MNKFQEAVNALIDNTKRQNKRPVTGANNRPLKSLTDLLKGKQTVSDRIFSVRVDFSGRSVIVVVNLRFISAVFLRKWHLNFSNLLL